MPRECRRAEPRDVPSWLSLVAEVETLFGPMPDFERHAVVNVARGTAYVVVEADEVIGAVLVCPDDRPHEITWLAVRGTARRTGIGRLLVDTVLERWPSGDVAVVTFAPPEAGPGPARGFYAGDFYAALGFTIAGAAEPSPGGGPRERWILRRARPAPGSSRAGGRAAR